MTQAIVIEKTEDGQTVNIKDVTLPPLEDGEVLVDVAYSTLNYKDGLALTGASPVVRSFPMVPGIDFAGVVAASRDNRYAAGDRVILNGWSVGEKYWGGLAEQAKVMGDWLVPMPESLTMRQAMAVGTAGYTAMLCVLALEEGGVTPESGEVVVTGATGGVGSFAVYILAQKGYQVAAVTGRTTEADYLEGLGAKTIVAREDVSGKARPLNKERWAGAVDVVGGEVLANVLSMTRYGGTVAACGLAGSMDLPTSVAPFILRGVTLKGVDSVMCPFAKRKAAWEALADILKPEAFAAIEREIAFNDVISVAPDFLEGKVKGRIVVPVDPSLDQ